MILSDHARALRCLAAIAPRLHVHDDRDTPLLMRRDASKMPLIWGVGQCRAPLRRNGATGNWCMAYMRELPVVQLVSLTNTASVSWIATERRTLFVASNSRSTIGPHNFSIS